LIEEEWLAITVQRLAKNFASLHTFVWDGLEMPTDELWLTLRTSCPMLETIGCTIGPGTLNPNSHLYDFSGLLGFSLIDKMLELTPHSHILHQEFPERLWKMLLERCPQLQELSLGRIVRSWPRCFNIRRVTKGQWPCLRSLTLGLVLVEEKLEDMLSPFLATHAMLQTLDMPGYSYRSLRLPHSSLPRLVELTGPTSYLTRLPGRHLIRTLRITYFDAFDDRVVDLLRMLTSLTSLCIWVDLKPYNPVMVIPAILEACPLLSHLEIMSSSKSQFPCQELFIVLRNSRLRSLTITKRSRGSCMVQVATRLLRDNRSLQHLKVNIAQDKWSSNLDPQLKSSSTFERVVTGEHESLAIHEWWIGLFGRVSRRYRYDL